MSFALLISNVKSFHKIGSAYLKTEYQRALHLQRQTSSSNALLDFSVIHQKSLDRAIFLYIFLIKVRLNGVRASITSMRIRKF